MKEQLNLSQRQAVTATEGPVLVIAGAGSGKTRVIEYRVLHLVERNVDPAAILLLTFTREAARKMLERAGRHDTRCHLVAGGTFHSFGYKLIRKHAALLGLSEFFSVLDESDAKDAIHKCIAIDDFFKSEKRPPKAETLKNILSAVINKNITVVEILQKEYPDFLKYADEIEKLKHTYDEFKRARNMLDYDDLLIYTKMLLEKKEIRQAVSSKYEYIMIDEYQDTNLLQAEIAYHLASFHKNIMAVGDDAQSIYGFRGANHENIMKFPKQFKGCKIIKLEENYRSTQSILNLANAVLENMEHKYSKCLISARGECGEKPQLLFFNDAYLEASLIAQKIRELIETGVELTHQAVLFRSAYVSIPLQAELTKLGIPYQVFGGLKFYETAHVKDVLAHLRVILNPKDEVSWGRILTLIEGIGPRTAEKIIKEMQLYGGMEKSFKSYERKSRFGSHLQELRFILGRAHQKNTGVRAQFEMFLEYYLPMLKNKFDDWNTRLSDLETLKEVVGRYVSLQELLADFAIESPDTGTARKQGRLSLRKDMLTLSTIHSAKGLEWDYVFVLGLMEGAFPISFSLSDDDEIEEEHRLFYVAVTRAKNNLFLSLHHEARNSGNWQFNTISRFVDKPNVLNKVNRQVIIEPEIDGKMEPELYLSS